MPSQHCVKVRSWMKQSTDASSLRKFWFFGRNYKLILALLYMAVLPVIGMLGLVFIEDWPPFDAFYMAVTTLTTVGFGEIHPLGTPGRIFIICYLVIGLGSFLYALSMLGETIVTLAAERNFWRKRMEAKVEKIRDHVIVCGHGRMGKKICDDLATLGIPFVVVDRSEAALEASRFEGYNCVVGDATQDEILERCGVGKARGVVAALSTDADNLLLVISAKLLNAGIRIVSRVNEEGNARKLERAGALEVICMYQSGAERLVQHVLRN
jgi:voltage-gated potassium channel